MKIAGITLERPPRAGLVHLAGCWAAGFLAAACSLEGRAPLAGRRLRGAGGDHVRRGCHERPGQMERLGVPLYAGPPKRSV